MVILAIETSCDDTAIAVVEIKGRKNPRFNILSNIVSSQVKLHAQYGGVYPSLAKREHQKNLPIVLKKTLKIAGNIKIDAIAVTVGPGLEPCLWTGINFAKELSQKMKLPLIPVNHIEAHILANFINRVPSYGTKVEVKSARDTARDNFPSKLFTRPAICLIVSGGHTQIILMKGKAKKTASSSSINPASLDSFGNYKIIGETRDDAAGECFDKAARLLGLSYPGGPAIAKLAAKSAREVIPSTTSSSSLVDINLPRPMIRQKNYDFSFSGLKTAVLYKIKSMKPAEVKNETFLQVMAAEIQQSIIDVLIHKTIKATKDCGAKTIILGGGVSANNELRKQFKKACLFSGFNFLIPPKNLSADNAAMIAVAGYFHLTDKTTEYEKIKADANLRIG